MFTYFTDRDGKFQLKSLAESGFDPLARSCQFMLTEEAHHMFVGDTGISRVVKRTLEVMKELGTEEPDKIRAKGAIDLPTMQRYLNFWFTSSLDLFGAEISSNAASYFANGIKGRPDEANFEDHICKDGTFTLEAPSGSEEVPMRNAMNEVTRMAYIRDCEIGVKRWNRLITKAGFSTELTLPSERFRRSIGAWAGQPVDPAGRLISTEEWNAKLPGWIPSESDRAFVKSLMQRVIEPGKMAGWIAPPDRGINNLPVDYEYVHLH
jgi:benzoyl-CoA 2,3-dioxygenase component B